MRSTHTVATLEISTAAYDEIAQLLRTLGCNDVFMSDGTIDMTGIGLVPASASETTDVADGAPAISGRITVLEDYNMLDQSLEPITAVELDVAGQRLIDDAVRRRAKAYSVPRDWWERYAATRATFRALEQELKQFPRYGVSWHARLSLEGETICERETNRWPPA